MRSSRRHRRSARDRRLRACAGSRSAVRLRQHLSRAWRQAHGGCRWSRCRSRRRANRESRHAHARQARSLHHRVRARSICRVRRSRRFRVPSRLPAAGTSPSISRTPRGDRENRVCRPASRGAWRRRWQRRRYPGCWVLSCTARVRHSRRRREKLWPAALKPVVIS
jgi:hypothetical protein